MVRIYDDVVQLVVGEDPIRCVTRLDRFPIISVLKFITVEPGLRLKKNLRHEKAPQKLVSV